MGDGLHRGAGELRVALHETHELGQGPLGEERLPRARVRGDARHGHRRVRLGHAARAGEQCDQVLAGRGLPHEHRVDRAGPGEVGEGELRLGAHRRGPVREQLQQGPQAAVVHNGLHVLRGGGHLSNGGDRLQRRAVVGGQEGLGEEHHAPGLPQGLRPLLVPGGELRERPDGRRPHGRIARRHELRERLDAVRLPDGGLGLGEGGPARGAQGEEAGDGLGEHVARHARLAQQLCQRRGNAGIGERARASRVARELARECHRRVPRLRRPGAQERGHAPEGP
mmetsp:Transcript_3410/g.11329  ORF Transcript_3410/g.11329 Transcript_3410/m.11329 type:complete len:282 (+) Transcript_3410:1285-2130(+)